MPRSVSPNWPCLETTTSNWNSITSCRLFLDRELKKWKYELHFGMCILIAMRSVHQTRHRMVAAPSIEHFKIFMLGCGSLPPRPIIASQRPFHDPIWWCPSTNQHIYVRSMLYVQCASTERTNERTNERKVLCRNWFVLHSTPGPVVSPPIFP